VVVESVRATSPKKKNHRKSAVRLLPLPRAMHNKLLLLINKRSQKHQAMIIIMMLQHHYLLGVLLLLHCRLAHRRQQRRRMTTPTALLYLQHRGHQNHHLRRKNQTSTHSNASTSNRQRMTWIHRCLILIRLRSASLQSHQHHRSDHAALTYRNRAMKNTHRIGAHSSQKGSPIKSFRQKIILLFGIFWDN